MDTPADSLSSRASFANGDQRFYAARGSSYSNSPDDREFGSPWDYPLDGTTTTQTPDERRRERDWDVETVRDWDTSDARRRPSPSRYDGHVRSLQEEIQRLEEGLKRKDEEIRKRDEEIRRFEQELRKMQVVAKRKAEEEHKAREETRRNRETKKKERDAILEAESGSERDNSDQESVRRATHGKTRSRHEANGGYGRRIQLSYSGAASLHPPHPSTSSQPASRSASPGRTKKRPPPPSAPASPPPARAPSAAPAHRTTNGTTTTWPAMQLPALDPAWRAQYQFEQQQREYRHQLVEQSYKPSVKEVADRVVKQMAAAQHAQMADSDWEGIRRKNGVTESRFRKPLGSRR